MEPPQVVILFHGSAHALRAEKVLQEGGIAAKLIPVPRQLSSDCGVCLRLSATDRDAACRAIRIARVEIAGVHAL
jgi:hypothetical protein